jgi:hypothetical protein
LKKWLAAEVLLVLISSINIFPQAHISFSVTGTYNLFGMTDETGIQNQLLQQIHDQGIPAVATESFPAYYGMQFRIMFIFPDTSEIKYLLGPYLDVASTGGRIDYKDYSGEVKVDQLFSAYSLGFSGEMKIPLNNNFYLSPSLSIPLIFGSFKVKSDTRIGNSSTTQELDFNATSFGFQPGISLSYDYSHFTIGINASYLISLATTYTLDSNANAELLNSQGGKVTMGMNGVRLGIILGCNF